MFWHKVPGNFLTDWVGSVRDSYRLRFLTAAAAVEPDLLPSLRAAPGGDARSLSAWAGKGHLTEQWCLDTAGRQWRRWKKHPESATTWNLGVQEFGVSEDGAVTADGDRAMRSIDDPGRETINWVLNWQQIQAFNFGVPMWNPTRMTRAAYRKGALTRIERTLDRYCDSVENLLREQGYAPAPNRRELRHFEWLARYQVTEESFPAIAQSAQAEPGAVKMAVRRLAEYIELPLRPARSRNRHKADRLGQGKRGRPPGAKDTMPRHRVR